MTEETSYYKFISRVEDNGVVTARYKSTSHAGGAWKDNEQHMSPATGIISAELEQFHPRDDLQIARLSFDILGTIHAGEFEVVTTMIRPGRTIELIESKMIAKGRPCIIGRTWRIAKMDTSEIAGLEDRKIPSHEELPEWNGMEEWPGGHIASIIARADKDHRRGKGIVWITTPYDMIEGIHPTPFVRLMGLVDTMNGVFPRLNAHKSRWAYPNLDLQIHLFRLPEGDWLGIDGTQQYGVSGVGLTSARLHDIHGPFGHAEQILTLRPL